MSQVLVLASLVLVLVLVLVGLVLVLVLACPVLVNITDLHLKPSDAMDRCQWRKMTGGNWSDRSTAVIVMLRDEQELYVSDASAHPG